MSIEYNYAYVLKKLIERTKVKMIYVGKTVGYDISYISKWCSGQNLPTHKNKDKINESLALLFAEEYFNKSIIDTIKEDFEIEVKPCHSVDSLVKTIHKLLAISYCNSKKNVPVTTKEKVNRTCFVNGTKAVVEHFQETLRNLLEETESDLEILSTVDLSNMLRQMKTLNFSRLNLKDILITAKFCLNMEVFKKEPDENIRKIYHFLNSNINSNVWIFDQKEVLQNNVFVIKNTVAFLFSISRAGEFLLSSETWDKDIVNSIYETTINYFDSENIILKPEAAEELSKKGYRTKFYSTREFSSFNAFGFEYLLPTDISDLVAEKAANFGNDLTEEYYIKKLQITWEECFSKGNIRFIIPKSNVLKYIEMGKIFYLNVPFTLTVEQRQQHARHIVKCMNENPNIKIVILEDDEISYIENDYNISLYYNHKKAYMKRNGDILNTDEICLYYVVLNQWILDYLNTFLTNLCKSQRYTEITPNEIENLIEKYEPMFLRMLDI
ncbi:MAG: hypothetical protein ACRCW1_08225 [Anaerotignaceae bacterium]